MITKFNIWGLENVHIYIILCSSISVPFQFFSSINQCYIKLLQQFNKQSIKLQNIAE